MVRRAACAEFFDNFVDKAFGGAAVVVVPPVFVVLVVFVVVVLVPVVVPPVVVLAVVVVDEGVLFLPPPTPVDGALAAFCVAPRPPPEAVLALEPVLVVVVGVDDDFGDWLFPFTAPDSTFGA